MYCPVYVFHMILVTLLTVKLTKTKSPSMSEITPENKTKIGRIVVNPQYFITKTIKSIDIKQNW